MAAYDRLRAALETAADIAGGVLKIALGTPGKFVLWPDPAEDTSRSYDSGGIWIPIDSTIVLILQKIAAELDVITAELDSRPWAKISTNGTGMLSTITAGKGVESVVKDEQGNTITVTLDTPYSSANWIPMGCDLSGSYLTTGQVASAADTTIIVVYALGVQQDINNRTIGFFGAGVI